VKNRQIGYSPFAPEAGRIVRFPDIDRHCDPWTWRILKNFNTAARSQPIKSYGGAGCCENRAMISGRGVNARLTSCKKSQTIRNGAKNA
jgi:hypothetical protein